MEESLRRELPYLRGKVVDLAAGTSSYRSFFSPEADVLSTDYIPSGDIHRVVDINQPLPFSDASLNGVLLANALYIIEDRPRFWREVHRVLSLGGVCIVYSPFIANEMPEPHDFERLTYEGLEREVRALPWKDYRITRIGERFSAAANLLHPFWRFSIVRLMVYGAALVLDRWIPERARRQHPCPLGYLIHLRV